MLPDCTFHAVRGNQLIRGTIDVGGDGMVASDGATRVPPELLPHVPPFGAVVQLGARAPCTARVGPPLFVDAEGRPILGHRVSGCPRGSAPFAFACERADGVPAVLRWAPIRYGRPRSLPPGPLAGIEGRAFDRLGQTMGPAELRLYRDQLTSTAVQVRRVRDATFTLGTTELRFVEAQHAFFESAADIARSDACPSEFLASFVFARAGERWSPVAVDPEAEWLGVIHDGSAALAIVERGAGPGAYVDANGVRCFGAADCDATVAWARSPDGTFAPSDAALSDFTGGQRTRAGGLSYASRCAY